MVSGPNGLELKKKSSMSTGGGRGSNFQDGGAGFKWDGRKYPVQPLISSVGTSSSAQAPDGDTSRPTTAESSDSSFATSSDATQPVTWVLVGTLNSRLALTCQALDRDPTWAALRSTWFVVLVHRAPDKSPRELRSQVAPSHELRRLGMCVPIVVCPVEPTSS